MNIIIYESSSFGGCYEYALQLFRAYSESRHTDSVALLLPVNASTGGQGIQKILMDDSKAGKLYFLRRQWRNPLILLRYLKKAEPSFVLLNDFEQITAPFWSPLYRLFLRKHVFGVFLHDADRDAYPPSRAFSAFCMKKMMRTVSLALFHAPLPERSYYRERPDLTYLPVQHGLYPLPDPDPAFLKELRQETKNFSRVFSIPGNIRAEKNYLLVFRALSKLPGPGLVIAGKPSSGSVSVEALMEAAREAGVFDRIVWKLKYLSDAELSAVLNVSDLVVLYYSASFHSQSGILHQVIPSGKPVLVSDLPSAMTSTVKMFNLGYTCKPDDPEALTSTLGEFLAQPLLPDFTEAKKAMDWKVQVEQVLEILRSKPHSITD
ncbi:MAG: glycosyltransferase [Bacteroidota bacterium]